MAMQRKRRRRSGGNNNNNPNPNRHYESNGPDVRIRGSAQQILEKYLQYARDAQTSGDRVKAEALFQHAEHYARIVAEFEKQKEEARLEREARDAARAEERAMRGADQGHDDDDDNDSDGSDEDGDVSQGADSDAESDPSKPRRRARRPRAEHGSEASASTVNGDAGERSGDTEGAPEQQDKPKRRRTYARQKDSSDDSDGVMKTLARGSDEVVAEAD